jgi:1,4-alpha-glucan branching enzyme
MPRTIRSLRRLTKRSGHGRQRPLSDVNHASPKRFGHFLENHVQAANIGFGERLATLTSPAMFRALTALLLLGPQLPLLFQGQETGSRAPWRFFVDHRDELAAAVRAGRADFVKQFPRLATAEAQPRSSIQTRARYSTRISIRASALQPSDRRAAPRSAEDSQHRSVFSHPAAEIEAVLSDRAFARARLPATASAPSWSTSARRSPRPRAEPLLAPPASTG